MLRRPRFSDRSIVDLSVVVYSGRALVGDLGERPFGNVRFDPNSNVVSLFYTGEKPRIRNGSWILDATLVKPLPAPAGDPRGVIFQADPHGFFYRVVNVTEPSGNQLDLELQTRPRLDTTDTHRIVPILPGQAQAGYGVVLVLDNVVEVFDKGAGWRP